MSEPSHLIPNLNEMLEAYIEVEEETVQETQSREMQAKERTEDRGEPGQLGQESRKRKRGAENVRSLISEKAAALMEKSLKEMGFIVERGFKKLTSSFTEMLENEMLEAYIEVEEETVQETQSREMQAKERTEDRGEPGQLG